MPKVRKQSARTVRKNRPSTGGVLDQIVSVKEMVETGIKMCLYGRGKTGKTSLACTFPKPLLILGTEDGTRSVRSVKDVDFLFLSNSQQIDEIISEVSGNYKTIILDTAGGLQDMILKEILGLDDVPIEKSWGLAAREQWQCCGMQTKEKLRSLLSLADSSGINIVVIAHERNFSDEGGSDLIFPTVGAALTPSTAGWLNGACDYLCQTFLRESSLEKEVGYGKEKRAKMTIRSGKIEYCLRIGPHPIYMTGFRMVHTVGKQMPDVIVNPDYQKIKSLIM